MLLGISHNKRSDSVPHWLHQATMANLKHPCRTVDIYEGHIFDIGNSRQATTELILKISDATHILYVDDDLAIPDPNGLNIMFNLLEKNNEYIVSGLYYRKQKPHYPLIMACEETETQLKFGFPFKTDPPLGKVVKVGAVPAGFLLVKREVFEKVSPPWFVYNDPVLAKKQLDKTIPGEDIYFSLKMRRHGYNLWVDARVELAHYCPTWIGRDEIVAKMEYTSSHADQQIKDVNDELKLCETRVTATIP